MIQGLDYVDSDNLFLMGTSQGGVVSAITGAAHPEEIRGMVLLYPAFVLVDRANELFQSRDEISDTYYFMWMDVGRAYFELLLDYDIYREIAAYDKDVLLIHGDADHIVPPQLFRAGPCCLSIGTTEGDPRWRTWILWGRRATNHKLYTGILGNPPRFIRRSPCIEEALRRYWSFLCFGICPLAVQKRRRIRPWTIRFCQRSMKALKADR